MTFVSLSSQINDKYNYTLPEPKRNQAKQGAKSSQCHNVVVKLLIAPLEVIVNDDLVVGPWERGVFELFLGLV